jgi:putative GTP pyrophosphokinase
MDAHLILASFLSRCRIKAEVWEQANIEWSVLEAIAADYEVQSEHLRESAELFAKIIQKFDKVHSVRWRLKETDHLLEKIVRKRAEGSTKYADISVGNYFERVTDLIGIRALHLFKEDCFEIDTYLRALWKPIENPVAYIRAGDSDELKEKFKSHGLKVKHHPAGYRSIHYVISSQPTIRKVVAEIQVRTIFEEGWSEIDHKIRYPNFSDNEHVEYFLTIFNRMAGSADEMGSFVKELTNALSQLEKKIVIVQAEKEESVHAMEDALAQMEQADQDNKASKESIEKLKAEVAKLKAEAQAGASRSIAREVSLATPVTASAALTFLKDLDLLKKSSIESGLSTSSMKALKDFNAINSELSPARLKAIKDLEL